MPVFKDKWHVSEELIDELRTKVLNTVNSSPEESALFHPEDVKRVRENDWYIVRYILHQEFDIEQAYKMLVDSLKFRKEYEVNTIRKKDLPIEYFNVRAVILYNKDHRDHPLVVVRGKTHIKREDTKMLQKQYWLYWVEKGVRASNWGAVSILFDCTDAGISNMDLDLIRFIFDVFKKYYPWGLGYFLVYNMPWYMSTFWKIIKQWIPEKYVEKICFVDKKSIRKYVEEDQLPIVIGGTCTKMYDPIEGVEDDSETDNEIPVSC
ncbi:motile sperm domain-containing protein 2-like [Uloborus diversus]|uniref:motile sperm domain-containing protein 2-like n=1 Tax=Uloborus diversus TaxID=327109 RepID=UPI00240A4F2F|nr:motile sperm domain-containing protein 2-like [Uloborus diversus]